MRSVFDLLSAGASVAAIAGVVIQVYLIRREHRSAQMPATAPAGGGSVATSMPAPSAPVQPAPGVPAPYGSPERAAAPKLPLGSILAAPPRVAGDSGVGSVFMGLWQLFWILGGLGWLLNFQESWQSFKGTSEELASSLRLAVVILVVNAVWAALLARRHWPAPGQSLRSAKDRLWFYLAYAPIAAVTGVALLIVRSDLIF